MNRYVFALSTETAIFFVALSRLSFLHSISYTVRRDQRDLAIKINNELQHIFTSKKLVEDLEVTETKCKALTG